MRLLLARGNQAMTDDISFKTVARLEHTPTISWKMVDWVNAAKLLARDDLPNNDIADQIFKLVLNSVKQKILNHGEVTEKTKLGRPRRMSVTDAKEFMEVVESWRAELAEELNIPVSKLSYRRAMKARVQGSKTEQQGGKSKKELIDYFVAQIKYSKILLKGGK